MNNLTVDKEALLGAASRVASSADAYGQSASLLDGLGSACAQTPASGACDDLASTIESILSEQVSATASLAEALLTAADAYALADRYAF